MEDLIASLLSGVRRDHQDRVRRPPMATKKRLTGAKSRTRKWGAGRGELVWKGAFRMRGVLLKIECRGAEKGVEC